MLAQTPLPDASSLAPLHPAVAITLIAAGVILALLAAFKDPLRDRLRRAVPTPPDADQPATVSATAATQALPAVVSGALPVPGADAAIDRLEHRTDQLLDRFQAEINAADDKIALLEQQREADRTRHQRDLDQLRGIHAREVADLRSEIQRLQRLMWQRGPM